MASPDVTTPLALCLAEREIRHDADCARRFEVRFDSRFREVMERCGDPRRPHGWITPAFVDAYTRLFELGWGHSVEIYADGELVGGLYGLRINGLFAGESMFHSARDASKVALVALVAHLRATGATLLDVQWTTEHLVSLGATDIPRAEYLRRLADALAVGANAADGYPAVTMHR